MPWAASAVGSWSKGILLRCGDFLEGAIQLLVGNGQADVLGALTSDLLEDQSLEHLLLEHALWEAEPTFCSCKRLVTASICVIEFALQDEAVVDDGGDAIQHSPCTPISRV